MSELDFSKEAKRFLSSHSECDSQESSFCEKIENMLSLKAALIESKYGLTISLSQLKEIYSRGCQDFANSYQPNTTRAQWGICRVNSFLKLIRGVSDSESSYFNEDLDIAIQCKDFKQSIAENLKNKKKTKFDCFSDTEFALARVALAKFDIDKSIQNSDDEELFYSDAEKKTLNKPFRLPKGSSKKFGVYVKNPKTGNVIMVKFGDPNMEIKRDDPERRRSFRARHKCDTAKDKTTPRYWSCKMWSKKPVNKSVSSEALEWDDEEIVSEWGWDESMLVEAGFFDELGDLTNIETIEEEGI